MILWSSLNEMACLEHGYSDTFSLSEKGGFSTNIYNMDISL